MEIVLNLEQTLGVSVVVLLLGILLVNKIWFLSKFCIPAPVVGGLVFAVLLLIGYTTETFTITMDMTLKNFFMLCFFTTVGYGANVRVLKTSGIGVAIFLAAAVVLVICQNIIGVVLATVLGQNPLFGLITGSVPLVGGHGTAGAFGPEIENMGLAAAQTVAIAAATFGLIAGSLIGGPTGRRLVLKHNLKPSQQSSNESDYEEVNVNKTILHGNELSYGFFQIGIAIGLGSIVSIFFRSLGLTFPSYIGAMLVAAIIRNIIPDSSKMAIRCDEINALGSMFLSIFLVQALMSLKLWELAQLALPLIVILSVQVLFMFVYANFVIFNVMGRTYDAAVLSAGSCGFGLGATPNGIANMNAVTNNYGPSVTAFFILPIVGALFIDFINSGIITLFIQLLT